MKKSKTEDQIVKLIQLRQVELAIKAAEEGIKALKNPPKTFNKSMKSVGKTMGYLLRAAQLQRAKNIIKPKPERAKGGFIRNKDEILIPNRGEKIVPEKLFIKNPLP